jgi:hypothetical protein
VGPVGRDDVGATVLVHVDAEHVRGADLVAGDARVQADGSDPDDPDRPRQGAYWPK